MPRVPNEDEIWEKKKNSIFLEHKNRQEIQSDEIMKEKEEDKIEDKVGNIEKEILAEVIFIWLK